MGACGRFYPDPERISLTTTTIYRERIPSSDPRLRRHVLHDSRSWAYRYPTEGLSISSVEWHRVLPVLDQGNVGSCFPPGTRIRMADGSERTIEEVRLLEEVVTAEGRTGRVTRMMARQENGGLIRILTWGHAHLRLTREHPVLTSRGYVPAGELAIGDEVAMPKYTAGQVRSVSTAEVLPNPTHRLIRGNRWNGVQGRKGLRVTANPLPEKIDLNPATGRLLGLFLAEGSCDPSKARYTFSAKEKETLVAETVVLLRQEWGVEAHVADRPNNSINVTIYGTGWSRLLHALCGNGAGMKTVHPSIMGGSAEFLEAVLDGWLAGDGCIRKCDGARSGVTISRDLALAMFDIGQALGRHPVIDWRESPQNSAAKVRQPRWTLTFAPGPGRCRETETHVWRKVRELRVEEYVGPVYNLSVEGDESYVAEGIGVHNCTAEAGFGCLGTAPYYTDALAAAVTKAYGSFDQAGAYKLYSAEETLDGDGPYPPQDNGSTGLTLAKVLRAAGLISGWTQTFTLDDALKALTQTAFVTGTVWYNSMFTPSAEGVVTVDASSGVAGGHEYEVVGYDDAKGLVRFANSWGAGWGVEGYFFMQAEDWGSLLAQQGDVTIFTPVSQPAPTPTDPDAALAAVAHHWVTEHHIGDNARMAHALKTWLVATGR